MASSLESLLTEDVSDASFASDHLGDLLDLADELSRVAQDDDLDLFQ